MHDFPTDNKNSSSTWKPLVPGAHCAAAAIAGNAAGTGSSIAALHQMLDLVPEAILISNERGEITMVNAQTEQLFGYRRDELLDQKVELLVPERYRTVHEAERKHFYTQGRARSMGIGGSFLAARKDGREVPVEISIRPMAEEGLYFSVIVDITERKRMEEELEKARMRLIAADRMSAVGLMAGGIAHEINNPLGIIHGSVSLLLEMTEEGEVSKSVISRECSRILQTAERIAKIIVSMRLIAREGSGDPFREVAISQVVEQTLELCKERFYLRNVRLKVIVPDEVVHVSCREGQIGQVLLNLLQNALDAVLGTAGEKWTHVEVETSEQEVSIHVIDSGPGVPPELAGKIMEPFFTTKPVGQGTGLGLSLSKAIAEAHRGELVLTERQGHTCFSLILPRPGRSRDT